LFDGFGKKSSLPFEEDNEEIVDVRYPFNCLIISFKEVAD